MSIQALTRSTLYLLFANRVLLGPGALLPTLSSAFPLRDGRPDAALAEVTKQFPSVESPVHCDLPDAGFGSPSAQARDAKFSTVQAGGRVEFSTLKTVRGIRTVALSPDVVAVLKEHRSSLRATEDDDPMFPSTTGTVLNPRNFERAFKAVIVLAGVRPVRLHDVRHLHVSLLVGHGLDIQAIADLVGHADASFTLRAYAHAFEDRRRSTAVPLGELLA